LNVELPKKRQPNANWMKKSEEEIQMLRFEWRKSKGKKQEYKDLFFKILSSITLMMMKFFMMMMMMMMPMMIVKVLSYFTTMMLHTSHNQQSTNYQQQPRNKKDCKAKKKTYSQQ